MKPCDTEGCALCQPAIARQQWVSCGCKHEARALARQLSARGNKVTFYGTLVRWWAS